VVSHEVFSRGFIPAKLFDKIKNAMIQRLKDKNIIGVQR
jgi:hypothetical protein